MAVRTALLNGNNINLDSDFSKYVESLTSQWVISWFDMTTTSVGVGKAFVKCTRTNGETIMVYVENTESIAISGNWYIVIKVPQAMIDDWTNNPTDWIGIATVELVETLPSANYMTLWQIVGGVLADVRYFIPKVQQIDTLNTRMDTAEADIVALELAGVPDHLEQSGIIWDKYTLSDKMFKQAEPTASNSTSEYNVWDVANNTQVHIQRIWSWTASNTIALKVKMSGSPTTTLHCDVYAGQKYDVSWTESAWYGTWTALATSSKVYSTFSSSWQTITFTLDNAVWWTKGQLLDIVVYQEWNIVNASNFYVLACDSTQYSEAFRCLGVNWTTRTPSYLMPYCHSDWFEQYLICKTVYYYTNKLIMDTLSWNHYFAKSSNSSWDQTYAAGSYVNSTWWTITTLYADITQRLQSDWTRTYWFEVNDWTNSLYTTHWSARNTTYSQTLTLSNVPNWKTINFVQHFQDYWDWTMNWTVKLRWNWSVDKKSSIDVVWFPKEIKSIWEYWAINVWWVRNWVLFNWFNTLFNNSLTTSSETTTTATAGSITPWNFAGYLVLWNKKIPYYT